MFAPWQAPVANNAFIWVVIGRLMTTKGCLDILQAFAALHQAYPHMQLHFYGDGKEKQLLLEKIAHLQLQQSVYLHGNIPMAWQKLYQAHAFVFASWYEGFSGALVEAMLTGVPIVASNIPMNAEAVTHNKTARIFQVQDVTDLQTQMLWIFQNYQQAQLLGQQARKEAFARFDMQQIGANYLQIVAQYSR
jgi:glycosyltransferase involved in cell wall biosynthesis